MIKYYKRGRPRKIDNGKQHTPETYWKNKHNITAEPIDYLLKKGIITDDMHKAALKFRWLYTVKFGAPTIQSSMNMYSRSSTNSYSDESYNILKQNKALKIVQDVCVYHYPLQYTKAENYRRNIESLQAGLELLCRLFFPHIYQVQ